MVVVLSNDFAERAVTLRDLPAAARGRELCDVERLTCLWVSWSGAAAGWTGVDYCQCSGSINPGVLLGYFGRWSAGCACSASLVWRDSSSGPNTNACVCLYRNLECHPRGPRGTLGACGPVRSAIQRVFQPSKAGANWGTIRRSNLNKHTLISTQCLYSRLSILACLHTCSVLVLVAHQWFLALCHAEL